LLDIARDERLTGINIDLEDIAYSDDIEADRAAFTDFIQELADSLHAMDRQLIISVPAKSEESSDDDWAYPYDLAALGQAADYLQLMTYDENGPWGDPGPVAGLDWVTKSVAYTAGLVDPAKLLLGLPAYAYDWDLTDYKKGEDDAVSDLYWTNLPDILAKPGVKVQRDAAADSPYLIYTEDGHDHEVRYEDAASIQRQGTVDFQISSGRSVRLGAGAGRRSVLAGGKIRNVSYFRSRNPFSGAHSHLPGYSYRQSQHLFPSANVPFRAKPLSK
jgi:spore germination protein YaaH